MNILILGVTSAIAKAAANLFAGRGDALFLTGRNTEELTRIAADLTARHNITLHQEKFDAEDFTSHAEFLNKVLVKMPHIDQVLLAFGDMRGDFHGIIDRNFTGAVSILELLSNYFIEKKSGLIAVISSVAGDRGRQSNYLYGAAKAGLSAYLQGLRNKLFSHHVHVLTIKPGPVDTPMIYGMPHIKFAAKPERVAHDIVNAMTKQKEILYTPWLWRYIMLIVKSIPESIFKKLKL
jgi:decaprenylphospho-beta-D-erythro-pentofuranosid-2-ulose 2-reductase